MIAANLATSRRITLWYAAAAPFWIRAAFADPRHRLGSWAIAARRHRVDLRRSLGFRVPGLGRSTTADWAIEGAHIAERCGLFVIIALGESILIIGASFADLAWNSRDRSAAFSVAFVGRRRDVDGLLQHRRRACEPADRSRPTIRARSRAAATPISHILIVAGIIVGGRGRRAGARPSRRSRRPYRHRTGGGDRSAARRSISSATRYSSGCRRRTCRCRIWRAGGCLAVLAPLV